MDSYTHARAARTSTPFEISHRSQIFPLVHPFDDTVCVWCSDGKLSEWLTKIVVDLHDIAADPCERGMLLASHEYVLALTAHLTIKSPHAVSGRCGLFSEGSFLFCWSEFDSRCV